MTRLIPTLAIALLLPLTLVACGGEDPAGAPAASASGTHSPAHASAAEPVEPRMEAGVQVVEIEAGEMGFQPRQIRLAAGVPARFVVTRTVDDDCSSQLTIPAFDIDTGHLPLGEPVAFEFTPDEAAEVEFVCGMEMQRGTIAILS